MIRHRASVVDLAAIVAVMSVAIFYAWQFDIFEGEGSASAAVQRIDLNETLLLSGLLIFGLLMFAIRRYAAQKRETQRRSAAEQIARELAFQDGLTGLPNRRQFDDALNAAIGSPPAGGAVHALLLLDLNGFKRINDVHGHATGDEVLIMVARRLLGAVRDGDLVVRFGGDEFAILARHLVGAEAATSVALRVIDALEPPIATGAAHHQVGVGIGIALIPQDATTRQEAVRKADVALYRAKAERRSALRFFEAQMDQQVRERHDLEQDLRVAVRAGTISAVYQPCVDIATGNVVAFDATPCWNDAIRGIVPAERLIPIAEETGLIHAISAQLLRDACAAAIRWPTHVALSLDLHPSQLKDPTVGARMREILIESGLEPRRVEIGINESTLVQDLDGARRILGELHSFGVKIALNAFGAGYSSLYHLRNFQLDKIKIDRSFVENMTSERDSLAIVNALIGLGEGLGLCVAAAGVSDPQQRALLLRSGCRQVQGTLFSVPVPADATMHFFAPTADRDRSAPPPRQAPQTRRSA